jgi:cholesterol oxidase
MSGIVRFHETLRGAVAPASVAVVAGEHVVASDHEAHAARGRAAGHELIFMLTVVTGDVDAMLADPRHASPVTGFVLAPMLGPRPLRVEDGSLDLFADVDGAGRALHMRYLLPLVDDHAATGAPRRWLLRGVKEVLRRRAWPTVTADTTTLFVDVWNVDGPGHRDTPVLRGVLHEGVIGVLAQLSSFRGDVGGLVRYLGFYFRALLRVYLGPRRAPLRPSWQARASFVAAPVEPAAR